MKITPSGLIGSISQTSGGTTIQNSYGGLQLHRKAYQRKVKSVLQQAVRSAFTNVQSTWGTLTTDQQDTWNTATDPGTSGFQLYSSTNNILVNAGITPIPEYTTPVSNPPLPFIPQTEQVFDGSGTTPTLDININYHYFDVPQGDWLPYYLWTGWIPSSRFRYPPIKKKMGPLAISPFINNVDIIFTADPGVGGYPPAEGYKMQWKEAYINTVTGQIFTVATHEVIAEDVAFPTPPYLPGSTPGSQVFTPGIPTATLTVQITSPGSLFDPTTWQPWFYINDWGTSGTEADRIIHTFIPVTAITFTGTSSLIITFSATSGDAEPPVSMGQTTLINIGWMNISSGLTEFEAQYAITAETA